MRGLALLTTAFLALACAQPARPTESAQRGPARQSLAGAEGRSDGSAAERRSDGTDLPILGPPRQLTFAGARTGEGYFGPGAREIVFQSERESGNPFYQIYALDLAT